MLFYMLKDRMQKKGGPDGSRILLFAPWPGPLACQSHFRETSQLRLHGESQKQDVLFRMQPGLTATDKSDYIGKTS